VDTLSYLFLIVTIIALLMLVIYLDARRNRWLDVARSLTEELARVSNSEKLYASLYSIACQANQSMAEGMAQYRATLDDLVPAEPITSPDGALMDMKYCGTCHTWRHANHFVVLPQHYVTTTP
jgi:hypothetical protein